MKFESWGRYPAIDQQGDFLGSRSDALPDELSVILPFGNGRSYGDSCLNENGWVLSTKLLNRFISFDSDNGILRCESGVLLKTILETFIPQGWFLPVVPGTQYITVGGAIGNDVHGKNHHRLGTFGHYVRSFELLRTNGERLFCSDQENADFFYATIAGLGLTGVITWADIQLRPIKSDSVKQQNIKYHRLEDFFRLSEESDENFEYSVAWLDCLAAGKNLGRGHFTRANHSEKNNSSIKKSSRTLSVPFSPPITPINKYTLAAFNYLYFNRQRNKIKSSETHYENFFFPLDSVANWNRMYGKKGFLQYQCVIPPEHSQIAIKEMLQCISKEKTGSFLAVLKIFGTKKSLGLMSYPMAGANLALDFPYLGEKTHRFLNQLDDIVQQAGGRVYPAKDAHMSAEAFQQYYPKWNEVEKLRDPKISSSFWRRVTGIQD